MTQKEMIVTMLGDYVSPHNDYFYDEETDEAWYWKGDCKVCTPFDDFVKLAFDKWGAGVPKIDTCTCVDSWEE